MSALKGSTRSSTSSGPLLTEFRGAENGLAHVTRAMMLGIINEMCQDRCDCHAQDQRHRLMEGTLLEARRHRVQNVQARPHLNKLNDVTCTRDWL